MRPQEKLAVIVMTNVDDANPERLAMELYDFVAPDIAKAVAAAKTGKPPEPRKANFRAYEGIFGAPRSAHDTHVAQIGEELVTVSLYAPPGSAKKNATRWKHVGGHSFRRIRADESLGEELRFETDNSGRAVRLWIHSNPLFRHS